ncbi:MAG TPA: polysaccharide biosynthesis/export family protein, partial [Steroidobacteraceae bacterium]
MRIGFWIALGAVLFVAAAPVHAQVPTAEQIELLKSMSPEDRQALMEQLGLGGAGGMSGDVSDAASAQGGGRDRVNDPLRRGRDETGDLEMRLAEKRIQPEDSVLIDIDFKKDKPPRIENAGAGLPPVTIPGELAPVLTPIERAEAERHIDLVRSRNPYQIDATGALLLPGFAPVMLAGLNEEQATHRLSAMVPFLKLDVKVTKLPVRKAGVGGLKPFGYDLFKDNVSTFAPVTDVPVPSDYIVGPGDRLTIQLFGTQNRTLRLVVGRDGNINFPEIGPVS